LITTTTLLIKAVGQKGRKKQRQWKWRRWQKRRGRGRKGGGRGGGVGPREQKTFSNNSRPMTRSQNNPMAKSKEGG
jgi:hypothetical protein